MVRKVRKVRNVRNVRLFYIHQGPGRTQRAAAQERGCKRAAQAQGSRQAKRPTTPLRPLWRATWISQTMRTAGRILAMLCEIMHAPPPAISRQEP